MLTKKLLTISLLLPLMAASASAYAGSTITDKNYWPSEARQRSKPRMTSATLLAQHRDRADHNTRKAHGDMYPEDHRQKDGVCRRNFDACHDGGFSARHGVCSQSAIGFADEDGRLTAKAPVPHARQSAQQPIRTAV
jgi:hypothetical protein